MEKRDLDKKLDELIFKHNIEFKIDYTYTTFHNQHHFINCVRELGKIENIEIFFSLKKPEEHADVDEKLKWLLIKSLSNFSRRLNMPPYFSSFQSTYAGGIPVPYYLDEIDFNEYDQRLEVWMANLCYWVNKESSYDDYQKEVTRNPNSIAYRVDRMKIRLLPVLLDGDAVKWGHVNGLADRYFGESEFATRWKEERFFPFLKTIKEIMQESYKTALPKLLTMSEELRVIYPLYIHLKQPHTTMKKMCDFLVESLYSAHLEVVEGCVATSAIVTPYLERKLESIKLQYFSSNGTFSPNELIKAEEIQPVERLAGDSKISELEYVCKVKAAANLVNYLENALSTGQFPLRTELNLLQFSLLAKLLEELKLFSSKAAAVRFLGRHFKAKSDRGTFLALNERTMNSYVDQYKSNQLFGIFKSLKNR